MVRRASKPNRSARGQSIRLAHQLQDSEAARGELRNPEGLIERYPGVDRAVAAAGSEMVTNGVSASKVKRVAQSMGIDRMSASQVSRMCSSLDDTVADLQERDPSDVRYPYIWLDATQQSSYPSTRRAGRCRRCARR